MPELWKFKDAVDVVGATFAVMVGFALTNFIGKGLIFDQHKADGATSGQHTIFYASSAFMAASLGLRFLIGSKVHLLTTYAPAEGITPAAVYWFVYDLVFLIAFGVVLVRLPSAKDPLDLLRWLMRFLGLSVSWGVVTLLFRSEKRFACFWVPLDLVQLFLTFGAFWYLRSKSQGRAERRPPSATSAYAALLLAIVYLAVFFVDLRWIIKADSAPPGDLVMHRAPQSSPGLRRSYHRVFLAVSCQHSRVGLAEKLAAISFLRDNRAAPTPIHATG